MTISTYGAALHHAVKGPGLRPAPGTPLDHAARDVLEMAGAYARDGMNFLEKGDPVNAIAAFAYGAAWLDAGSRLGLFDRTDSLPPVLDGEEVPPLYISLLHDKTTKYRGMLSRALAAVADAPDPSSPLRAATEAFLTRARQALEEGNALLVRAQPLPALSWYAYGHGWLDAGVRTGVLSIRGDRSLFAVEIP
ncbi:MAG: DUF357 domain-containing protein [Methanomicrobiales archaeon]|nr:DUF357 domain-containing protein [Methanomicrobiales archaeon]